MRHVVTDCCSDVTVQSGERSAAVDKMDARSGGEERAVVITASSEATVRKLSREDMLNERAELLTAAGMSEHELRVRGEAWELDAEHRGILARIDGLDFLLAHTPA